MTRYRTDGGWLPQEAVLQHVGVNADQAQAADVDRARRAAAAHVEQLRGDLVTVVVTAEATTVTFDPTPDVLYGAVLLAARLFARRSSPTGLASYGEFGPAAVLRLDPDVERLLNVGRYSAPRIG